MDAWKRGSVGNMQMPRASRCAPRHGATRAPQASDAEADGYVETRRLIGRARSRLARRPFDVAGSSVTSWRVPGSESEGRAGGALRGWAGRYALNEWEKRRGRGREYERRTHGGGCAKRSKGLGDCESRRGRQSLGPETGWWWADDNLCSRCVLGSEWCDGRTKAATRRVAGLI